jgi:hypothetical protein
MKEVIGRGMGLGEPVAESDRMPRRGYANFPDGQ